MNIERFQDAVLIELDGTESVEDVDKVMAQEFDRWTKEAWPAIVAYHRFLKSIQLRGQREP